MTDGPVDAELPRLLSLSVHELRTPITVVAGYLRMLLKDPSGILDARYRHFLEESEKSCARLSAIVAEMSDLSALESGKAVFKRAPFDLRALLADAVAALPDVSDRTVDVALTTGDGPAVVEGDSPRLKTALAAILHGLRREVVSTDRIIVQERSGEYNNKPASWIAIAEPEHIGSISNAAPDSLTTFDEWRGGCGLSLAIARRIIAGHSGALWSVVGGPKTAAVVVLPMK